MGRSPCCEKVGLKKGPWTPEEDQKLLAYIDRYGHGSWRALPAKAGLQRCGKSCRLRWTNYLRPDIKRGKFSLQEEQTIIQLHALLGNRWSAIATHLPKRTDNEIKNYWNTHLKKRLTKMGIDPVTHKPKNNALGSAQSKDSANLNHMAQWESARLEAEARLVRESKAVISNPYVHLPMVSSLSAWPLRKPVVPLPKLKQAPMVLPCLDILKAWRGVWTTNPNHHVLLNSNFGSLESPTSVLNFSDNRVVRHSGENSAFPTNNKIDHDYSKPHEAAGIITKENVQNKWNSCSEKVDDKVEEMLSHELESFPVDVPCIPDTPGIPSFLEGFTEDLLSDNAEVFNMINGSLSDNLGSCLNGNLEDNKKYWNAML